LVPAINGKVVSKDQEQEATENESNVITSNIPKIRRGLVDPNMMAIVKLYYNNIS